MNSLRPKSGSWARSENSLASLKSQAARLQELTSIEVDGFLSGWKVNELRRHESLLKIWS